MDETPATGSRSAGGFRSICKQDAQGNAVDHTRSRGAVRIRFARPFSQGKDSVARSSGGGRMIYICTCVECGASFKGLQRTRKYCGPCSRGRTTQSMRDRRNATRDHRLDRSIPDFRWRTLAGRFVVLAKELGVLPPLKDPAIRCVDCGAIATEYDHRDYSRPLDVDPVCSSCNKLRGPAVAPTYRKQKAA